MLINTITHGSNLVFTCYNYICIIGVKRSPEKSYFIFYEVVCLLAESNVTNIGVGFDHIMLQKRRHEVSL